MKSDNKLGRNLSDILKSDLPDQLDFIQNDTNRIKSYIPVNSIVPNPYQPRQVFDTDKLNELALSIHERGILTPILLRKVNDHYEIVAGERRFRAAQICGLVNVPAIVEHFNDQDMAEIALIENIQREDLNVMEEAQAYSNLMKARGMTQEELSKKLGKGRSYIANTMRLLTLPNEVQEMIYINKLSMGQARALIGLPEEQIIKMAHEICDSKMSVRDVEKKVNSLKHRTKEAVYVDEANMLSAYLGSKVKIDNHSIKISYKGEEELKNIIKKIMEK